MSYLPQLQENGVRSIAVPYKIILKGVCSRDGSAGARVLLDEMLGRGVRPTVVTFNTLVCLACQEGDMDAAGRLKEEMVRRGVAPNAVSFALLMRGLCDAGWLDDAKKMMFDSSGVQKERMVADDMYVMAADGKIISAPVAKPWPHKHPKCSDCPKYATLFWDIFLNDCAAVSMPSLVGHAEVGMSIH